MTALSPTKQPYVLKDFSTLKKKDDFERELALAYGEIIRLRNEAQLRDAMKYIYDKVEETSVAVKNLAITIANNETSLQDLYKNLDSLIETQHNDLNTSHNGNDSYASAVKRNAFSSSPAQAIMIQRAVIAAADKPQREKNVIFKNLPQDKNQLKEEIVKQAGNDKLNFLWLGSNKDSPTALRVKTASKEEASNLLQKLRDLRKIPLFANLSARPDYNGQELQVFKSLWKDAIARNNKENAFNWTVRNLRLVKNPKPSTWTQKPAPTPQPPPTQA